MTRPRSLTRRCGVVVLAGVGMATILAPVLAPNRPETLFLDRAYAPPMPVHLWQSSGPASPFVFEQTLRDRLHREFLNGNPAPLHWFRGGHLLSLDDGQGPLLLFGADALGRDVLARTLYGARLSLGVATLGVAGALIIGLCMGAWAGILGGRWDRVLMTLADFVLVLPAAYVILMLRAELPPVLSARAVFFWMAGFFAVSGWPHIARGVRAIVAAEQRAAYVDAARAAGAGPWRILRHILPAATGFLLVEIVLLFPAMLVAEITVSLLGLGFPEPAVSWGTLLQDAQSVQVFAEAPWMLLPAGVLVLVVLALHLAAGPRTAANLLTAVRRDVSVGERA